MDGVTAKRYLIQGAVREKNITYPNNKWGYGKVNIYGIFDSLRNL